MVIHSVIFGHLRLFIRLFSAIIQVQKIAKKGARVDCRYYLI